MPRAHAESARRVILIACAPARRAAPFQVPLAQKWLIQKANLAGKPAFVAGQVRGRGGEGGGAAGAFARPRSPKPRTCVHVCAHGQRALRVTSLCPRRARPAPRQVMEGMSTNVRPSRPEITDIVNAVYDGTDGLVLMQASLLCVVRGLLCG